MSRIFFSKNDASTEQIQSHLLKCDASFFPALSTRVSIDAYSEKLVTYAVRLEAWHDSQLIGLVAFYCECDRGKSVFVSNVSVDPAFLRMGIAKHLMSQALQESANLGFSSLSLAVNRQSGGAIALYKGLGFTLEREVDMDFIMTKEIARPQQMTGSRDYDAELQDTADHQYAYDFDFDVMHGYMMKAYSQFRRSGSVLELGSFKGDFTRRLLNEYDDVTCVEASRQAIEIAQKDLGDKVTYVHGTFEDVVLPRRYDNIILAHVLEHLDDPVGTLEKIGKEWLTDTGRLFVVCPNANAPSRQIAVKMGLISHNSAVTPSEEAHGHRITYSLDTLERDALSANLNIVHRSGIFFKALANFQWDRLLKTDIISPAYLDGCFALGQQYPDLCSSIYLICERSKS